MKKQHSNDEDSKLNYVTSLKNINKQILDLLPNELLAKQKKSYQESR